jgi:AraC-like DNA-binding protein
MLGSFSTELVAAPDRLEAWRWNARQICGDSRFHFPKSFRFHGSIQARRIAGLELTLFSSSALSFEKFPMVGLQSDQRACIAITQLAGVRRYCQDGKTAVLQRGDTTLIDSGRPWTSNCQGDCARLYMRLPYHLIEERLGLPMVPIAHRISGGAGLGSILFGLSTSLFRQAEDLTSEESTTAVEAYLKILSACVAGAEFAVGERRGHELFSRTVRYIHAHLGDADLGPSTIARAMGVSVRHIHRVFSQMGSSVADWIRTQRLGQCHHDLADVRQLQRSITEIAFSHGFNDSAHFSRAFRQEFGICPRKYRAHAFAKAAQDKIEAEGRSLLAPLEERRILPD